MATEAERSAVFYWSGGKDSAMALYEICHSGRYRGLRVRSFLTTITEGYDRVTGHGVRSELIELQAQSLGVELCKSYIPQRATMGQYETASATVLAQRKDKGEGLAVSGDIFVEKQRVVLLGRVGLTGCFPLWSRNSYRHVSDVIALGFKAYVVCVDAALLGRAFIGRVLDRRFLRDLPTGVDPCGENGEFHTFVFDGPIFREPVRCELGDVVEREGFYFCDVVH